MRQGFKFASKAVSSHDTMQAPVVAIHQHVLKSTTSFRVRTITVRKLVGCPGAELPLG